MTVKELIALLEKMPQDAIVINTMMSDYSEVEPYDITLLQGEEGRVIRHRGHLMKLRRSWWPKDLGEPEYLTAVHFKGN